ncbi:MAG TPA: AAA family ATPase [Nocardioidaceae bacterium]|nr:AAA family ATPase [Nocardioidaceae bacterium]
MSVPDVPDIERKVITALFCDLVGSTELAEGLDPEDVDRLLRTYHRLARERIESFGGTLEKFIGDAVLGVFGAPRAHEDDPARAVRASLRIIRDVAESGLGLHVRVGVHTGEAVVRVGEDRTAEEGLATGDTLNTAARLQNSAPVDGIVVSDATYRRALRDFDWADLGEVSVKGKAEPLKIWQPIAEPVASANEIESEGTPFLGRDDELAALVAAFDRMSSTSSVELVTILAEAGMGKSRLVRELSRRVAAPGSGVVWLRGRCLPYGDGISFWALGEIIKTHAGILETDDQESIGAKLDATLTESAAAAQRQWLRERVAPLVGLRTDSAPPPQEEAFAAWRSYLLSLTADGPVVILIEDLHWADPAFVAFLMALVDNAGDVPLLVVVTARPEVTERHAGWLDRARQSTVVQLVSLGDDAIAELVESALVGATPELVAILLERAAGSPLYAEQLAALVRERGLSAADASLDASAIPPTVQALLAARIDSLPRDLKPALLDAAVIGRVFWSGAVATIEGLESDAVDPALADLAHRELTRSLEPSTMLGEAEFAFWHALLRDVAYSFLPRAARLTKHRAAAAWITTRVDGQLGDLAEIVADHLHRALELATAIGADDELPEIRFDLASALIAAADHTMRVQPARADGQLAEALELLADDDERRGQALVQLAKAVLAKDETRDAVRWYGEAEAWHRRHDDAVTAAEIAFERGWVLDLAGDHASSVAVRDEARATLVANPGPGLVNLLAWEALELNLFQDFDATIARADEALSLARKLGLPEPYPALFAKGSTLLAQGDRAAESEIRRAIAIAHASGNLRDAVVGYCRIAGSIVDAATAAEALPVYDEAIAYSHDHGLEVRGIRAQRLDTLQLAGRLDDILQEAPGLRDSARPHGDAWTVFMADMMEIEVHLQRGQPTPPLDSFASDCAAIGYPPSMALGMLAREAFNRGDRAATRAHLEQAVDATVGDDTILGLLEDVWGSVWLGDITLARRLLSKGVPIAPTGRGYLSMMAAALVDEATGDIETAAARFAEATSFFTARGWVWTMAFGLAGCGRCAISLGDTTSGVAQLREARELALGLQAAPLLAEIDAAISAAGG